MVIIMKWTLSLLFLIVIFFSCKKRNGCDEELTIKREPYLGTEIRTDGYYHRATSDKTYKVAIMYRDGLLIYANFGGVSDLQSLDKALQITTIKNPKWGWGLFQPKADSIKMQYWFFSTCGDLVNTVSGLITSDSTFVIASTQDTMRFRFLNPKPDSTNNYIK